MASRILPLLTAALLASCSVALDSQYGIRFEPIPHRTEPRSESAIAAAPTPNYSVETTSVQEHVLQSMDGPNFNQLLVDSPTTAFDPVTASQEWTESAAPDFCKPAADALEHGALHYDSAEHETWPRKKPERSMTWAWVLWAVPAVLVLAQFTGFALMFGAHWYYLGKMRRARTATLIWALTLAVYIVFRVLNALKLSFLAGLVGLVGLLPLIVIMLYRLIADVILLSKMASKQARRSAKQPSNRFRKSI
jgi:hypothetical protein